CSVILHDLQRIPSQLGLVARSAASDRREAGVAVPKELDLRTASQESRADIAIVICTGNALVDVPAQSTIERTQFFFTASRLKLSINRLASSKNERDPLTFTKMAAIWNSGRLLGSRMVILPAILPSRSS